jgi:hypothetical protein
MKCHIIFVDGGWEEVRCSLAVAGIILTAGQLSEVTTTDWAMGLDSRLRYKFVFVTAQSEPETRPVSYTMHVRFFSFYWRVA